MNSDGVKAKAFNSQNFYSRVFSQLPRLKKTPEYITKVPHREIAKTPILLLLLLLLLVVLGHVVLHLSKQCKTM